MFCTKCGANVKEGVKFCTECGADMSSTPETTAQETTTATTTTTAAAAPIIAAAVQQQSFQQPVYQQPQYQQPAYQQPQYQPQPQYQQTAIAAPRKKRHVGLFVLLGVLIVLAGVIIYMLGSFSFFKPKNLGVTYTQADFNSVMQKLGMHVTADLGNGEKYDNAPVLSGNLSSKPTSTLKSETLKKKLPYSDYKWTFSNYQKKSVTLTEAEVTAFFNEIAPNFWWFDDTQVKVDTDGSILTSSKANIKKIKEELFADVAGEIPIPLPDNVNLYTKGNFSIKNNKIDMAPEEIKAGPVGVPNQYLTGSNLGYFSDYLGRFITVIPGLQIDNAGVKGSGFVFEGTIPTEISVTPKK